MSTKALVDELKDLAGEQCVFVDEPMSTHTTFRIGGPADVLVAPERLEDMVRVIGLVRQEECPLFVLGRGSNVLVADAGLRGVVVQIASNFAGAEIGDDGCLNVEAGITNAKVAALACKAGLAGYEFAAGIPGTLGGAAIMNAGAYGGEFKHVATEVTCLDVQGNVCTRNAEQARWGYRTSALADEGLIVLAAKLKLEEDDPAEIQKRMDDLARKRIEKQPLEKPSAGSTFKRPPGLFAGKLIQDAGMQGYQVGGAQVSEKHAGFVVNVRDASATDVVTLIKGVRAEVERQFGVKLEPEVRFWGFEDAELSDLIES